MQQVYELRFIAFIEYAFFLPDAEKDFLAALEIPGIVTDACLGELQPTQPERDYRGGEHGHVTLGQNSTNPGDRVREAFQRYGLIGCAHKSRCQIAAFGNIDRNERIFALVKFMELPLR